MQIALQFEASVPAIFFQCSHGVFRAPDGNCSICYTTSEEAAKWIADRLNEHGEMKAALEFIEKTVDTSQTCSPGNEAIALRAMDALKR